MIFTQILKNERRDFPGLFTRGHRVQAIARRWVRNQWNFKPSVSGVFNIPITYKES